MAFFKDQKSVVLGPSGGDPKVRQITLKRCLTPPNKKNKVFSMFKWEVIARLALKVYFGASCDSGGKEFRHVALGSPSLRDLFIWLCFLKGNEPGPVSRLLKPYLLSHPAACPCFIPLFQTECRTTQGGFLGWFPTKISSPIMGTAVGFAGGGGWGSSPPSSHPGVPGGLPHGYETALVSEVPS